MSGGDCFEAAIRTAERFEKAYVVHGLPVGQGPENSGLRYWHAWVEVRDRTGWHVHDLANGRVIHLPRAEYYWVGKMELGSTHRYSLTEARAEMARTGHYGPWVDGWEEMAEV